MDMSELKRLQNSLRGELRFDEPMARHVSWRAGGTAARAYRPADLEDLAAFVGMIRHDEPLLPVGLGSNLLVREGGFEGTVLFLDAVPSRLTFADGCLYAEAALPSARVARLAADHDRAGAEFLAGIPGTLGGALAMNAGCHGGETWGIVERVRMLDRRGVLHERSPEDFVIGYRHVGLKAATDEIFIGAWLRLPPGEGEVSRRLMRELLDKRLASQPLSLPNAGSVFRNPPDDHAARLIEAAGLKGVRIGGAQVSGKHANFIVNAERQATATDIEALIEKVQQVVSERFGVTLQREVRIVGEKP